MARFLVYTSPGRGHLYPTVPLMLELARRGHDVALRTLDGEVAAMQALGLRAAPIAPAIEAIEHDDWKARTQTGALDRAVRIFLARAELEIADIEQAIDAEQPDAVLLDYNCWGAAARTEKDGRPWALFMPYFLPWRSVDAPPFGPGLRPANGFAGRLRNRVVGRLVHGAVERNLPKLNALRSRVGVPSLPSMTDFGRNAPRLLYYTAEPFEYPRSDWPARLTMLGPLAWEPTSTPPDWLGDIDRPIVLVTCSTEYQHDERLIETAFEAFAGDDVTIVATTGSIDPARFRPPANARVERFVPHSVLLPRVACVICHGGMGITQKALAAAVPPCVVPFGRDQLEVAMHVDVAEAGSRLPAGRLSPARLREAVALARSRKAGAERVAAAFRAAGGAARGADVLEESVEARTPAAA